MKKKIFLILLVVIFGLIALKIIHKRDTAPGKKVGIILPIEHNALNQIVAGFKEAMLKSSINVQVSVENAQGDTNIQNSIIQKMISEETDLFVPVATQPTQMVINMIKDRPIVGLAASKDILQEFKAQNVTGVHDEVDSKIILDLIASLPQKIENISIIYSNNEKILPEVENFENQAKKLETKVQKIPVSGMPDLYTAIQSINLDSQAVVILKDNIVVSGISNIVAEAESRNIPVITSDQGTVEEGACCAIGVKEKDIGRKGAELAIKILQGESPSNLEFVKMDQLTMFINKEACKKQNIDPQDLKHYSEKNNIAVSYV